MDDWSSDVCSSDLAIAARGIPVFAIKGESLEDYWEYTHRIFEWSDGGAPNMILDDGGDATLLIHLGKRADEGDVAFIETASNEQEAVLYAQIGTATCRERVGYIVLISVVTR